MPRCRQLSITLVVLGVGVVLLAGCPRKPALAPGGAPAGEARPAVAPPREEAPAVSPSAPGIQPSPGVLGAGPAGPVAPLPTEFVEAPALRNIHFDFDRYEIRPQDAQILNENARWLKANPGLLVLIEGHCDERGTNEYNLALGERRAKATRDYLVLLGISAERITLLSYGEERPVCIERTEACWARNRRAHFLVRRAR
jgi:peptidoglycan-associated lipoprotein